MGFRHLLRLLRLQPQGDVRFLSLRRTHQQTGLVQDGVNQLLVDLVPSLRMEISFAVFFLGGGGQNLQVNSGTDACLGLPLSEDQPCAQLLPQRPEHAVLPIFVEPVLLLMAYLTCDVPQFQVVCHFIVKRPCTQQRL